MKNVYALLVLLAATVVQAQTLVSYEFTGNTFAPSAVSAA